MSADGLANVIGSIPYAEIRWKGEQHGVYTVLCRITPAQESGWESLAFLMMDHLHNAKLFVAKQLLDLNGRKGYLWNVSLWTQDPETALRGMYSIIQKTFAAPQADFQVRSQDPRARKQRIEHDPEMRRAQTSVLRTRRVEKVSQEEIRRDRARGVKEEFVMALPGVKGLRNVARGMTTGADGRQIPSEKGARGLLK